MSIIKLLKKVYKEVLFLLMVTCLILSIIKLFKKVTSNIFICIIPFTIMIKRNKQYFHSYDTFYYNNQKSNKLKDIITLCMPKLLL